MNQEEFYVYLSLSSGSATERHLPDSHDTTPPKRIPIDAEIESLLADRDGGRSVNMLHPAELVVSRDVMQALARDSMARWRQSTTVSLAGQTQGLILQRHADLLAWRQSHTDDEVIIAAYPASEDGLDDIESCDIAEDGEGDGTAQDGPF